MLDIALDVAKALLHLHRNNVLHVDLKVRIAQEAWSSQE